jgi:iron complex outermembrane recepter protein
MSVKAPDDFGSDPVPPVICGISTGTSRVGPRRMGWAIGVAAALLVAIPAGAQAGEASGDEEVQGGGALEEVVVTANKRSENIQNVPIAIQALSASDIANRGIQSTADIAAAVPGLTFQGSMNGLQPVLRGVGTTAISAGEENSIATYLDGVYIANLSGGLLQLNDIKSVEIDKGPQGTLFGRNATGGVISITTKDPGHEFSGIGSISYGNYQTAEGSLYVTGGISENLAANLGAYISNQNQGYGINLFNGKEVDRQQDVALRSKWLFTPTDVDRVVLAVDWERTHSSYLDGYQTLPGHPTQWGPGAPPFGQPFLFPGGPWDVDAYQQPLDNFKQGGASLNYQHEFPFGRLTNITAFREARKDVLWSAEDVPAPVETAGWIEKDRQISEEIQLASTDTSVIKWVGGFFFLDGSAAYLPFLIQGTAAAPAPLQNINFIADEVTKSYAGFGQTTAPLVFIPDTDITVGLRYTAEKRGLNGVTLLNFVPPIPNVATGQVDESKNFDKWTWRLALDHHFTDTLLGYVSYNRGFKSGIYNTIPPGGNAVAPEILDAYEAGIKSDWLSHRLRVNSSAFFYKYSQLQVTVFNATTAELENAANAHIYGVDLDVEAQPIERLTLGLSFEYLHDRFVSFPNAQILIPQTVAEGGGNLLEIGSVAGNRLPYTPDYSASASLDYQLPTQVGQFGLNAAYAYQSTWFAAPDNNLKAPISNLVNAQLSWIPARLDKLKVLLWARNLTNQAVPMWLAPANNPGGRDDRINHPPRMYGLKLQYSF